MNNHCLLENLINDCDQLIENLNDECFKLNQELQEMYGNSTQFEAIKNNSNPSIFDEYNLNNVSSEFPGSNSSLIMMDNNTSFSSSIFDPIAVSNGQQEDTSIDSERILNENDLIKMLMDNFIENAPLGKVCNGIDSDVLNHYLLSIQENSLVINTNETSKDVSMENFIEEIKSHSISLLETTYDPAKDGNLLSHPMEPVDQMKKFFSLENNSYPENSNNIVSEDKTTKYIT